MKPWVRLALGALLVLLGITWTLQGLDLLGQSGGMNGQRIWAVIGPVAAIVGLGLLATGLRTRQRRP